MSKRLDQLIENNRHWAEQFEDKNPGIFNKLVKQQKPDYLWIGCSDSRVPANTIVGLQPGEVFVHRNVGNLVNHSDINVLTVLEYAVKILGVKDIILCGHYGCGGIKAAMEQKDHGIVDNWIRSVKDIYRANQQSFEDIPDHDKKVDHLCELNVVQQVQNICHTSIVQDAWKRGQPLNIHGVIYGIDNGLIKDLGVSTSSVDELNPIYQLK